MRIDTCYLPVNLVEGRFDTKAEQATRTRVITKLSQHISTESTSCKGILMQQGMTNSSDILCFKSVYAEITLLLVLALT